LIFPSRAVPLALDRAGAPLPERHRGSVLNLAAAGEAGAASAGTDGTTTPEGRMVMAFDAACAAASSGALVGIATVANKLELYGLFKQATKGDAPQATGMGLAAMLDVEGNAKREAWASVRGVGEAAARRRYCLAVLALAGLVARPEGDEEAEGEPWRGVWSGEGAGSGLPVPAPLAQAYALARAAGLVEVGEDATSEIRVAMPGPPQGGVKDAVDAEGEDLDAEAEALVEAVGQGDADAVRRLLRAARRPGALARTRIDDAGTTLLHLAAEQESADVARALLDAGADVGAADVDGCTPLHGACAADKLGTVTVLLEAGADSSAAMADGTLALDLVPSDADAQSFKDVLAARAGGEPSGPGAE